MDELIKIKLAGKDENFQIALVQNPAIKEDWQKFNEQTFQFKVSDKKRQIISGYAMIADLEIDRIDEEGKPFKVAFTLDSIYEIGENIGRERLTRHVNESHQTNQFSEGVFIFEATVVDPARGTRPPEGYETKPGLFISMKVDNPIIWKKVEENLYRGFSIESKRFVEDQRDELDELLASM